MSPSNGRVDGDGKQCRVAPYAGKIPPTLVGIDHGFSFPLRYFEAHGLKPDWSAFLDDFQRHWPTDAITPMSISFVTARWERARPAWAIPAGGG
jgi:hypothetical protein